MDPNQIFQVFDCLSLQVPVLCFIYKMAMNQIVDPIALGTYGTCRALESFGKKRPSSEGGSLEN